MRSCILINICVVLQSLDICLIIIMSQKKGMQFFKKFSGDAKPSILMGMKIKGTKQQKLIAQTQTNFNFSQKKQEQPTSASITRDDYDLKKKQSQNQSPRIQPKTEDYPSKKTNVKLPENNTIRSQKIQIDTKLQPKNNQKQPQRLQVEDNKSASYEAVVQDKGSFQSDNKPSKTVKTAIQKNIVAVQQPAKPKKSQLPDKKSEPVKKSEKVPPTKKIQAQTANPRKASTLRQPQKPKKSDRDLVFEQINSFTIKLVSISLQQRQIKIHITNTKQTVEDLRGKISHWTSQQSTCAENQEYEQADHLQTQIEEAEKQITEMEIELEYMEDQIVKKEQEEVDILKAQHSAMNKMGLKLKMIGLNLKSEAESLHREELEEIQSIRNREEAQRKRIQRIQKDINHQTQQIREFEIIFKQEMDSKLNPLIDDKGKLQTGKGQLQSEIKELQKKLKQKRVHLAEVVKSLKGVNQSITSIKDSYKQQSDKLQERKNKLEVMQNQRDQMQLTLTDLTNKIAAEQKNMEIKQKLKQKQAEQLDILAKNIQKKQSTFEDQLQTRRAALDSFLLSVKLVKQFENKHREQKQNVQKAECKKNSIGASIARLQQKREQLKKKVPTLESQQKKFAEQKNFKAAGIKKGQIKDINDELSKIKQQLDCCLGQEHQAEIQLQRLLAQQNEASEEEAQLNISLAASQVKFNSEKLYRLQQYRTEISRAFGLQAKDKQKFVKQLDQEIQRLKDESAYLRQHFQLQIECKLPEPELQADQPRENDQNLEQIDQANPDGDQLVQQSPIDQHEPPQEQKDIKYQPPSLDNNDHQELEQDQNQGDGYVPLQLD